MPLNLKIPPDQKAVFSRKEETLLRREQEKTKPMIDDVISASLDTNMAKTVQDFVIYLRANDMPPKWASLNRWTSKYRSDSICSIYIELDGSSWSVDFFSLQYQKI